MKYRKLREVLLMSDVNVSRSTNEGFIVSNWNDEDDNVNFITFSIDEALDEVKRILEKPKK